MPNRPGPERPARPTGMRRIHRSATNVMSLAMVGIGFALIVVTIAAGGSISASGILLGTLFVLAGVLRLYLQLRGRL